MTDRQRSALGANAALRNYVQATADVHLGDDALARIAAALETATAALDEAAAESLFDTEPSQLQLALDALASDDA